MVQVTARSKDCVCGRSIAVIAGSNPAGSMVTHFYVVVFLVGDEPITPSG